MSAVHGCRRRSWPLLAALLASLLFAAPACALLGGEEEQPSTLEELPVVDDSRAFDPAQAVDDDDDLERDGQRGGDATDADAFAGSDSRVQNRADGAATTPASGNRAGDRGAARASAKKAARGKPTPGKDVPDDEHVASPAEVERLRSRRRADFEAASRAADSDAAAKTELSTNPPPEEIGPAKSAAWTVLDYTLEGLLLVIGALGITVLLALSRRFPKTVGLAVGGGIVLLALVLFLQAA